jgi:hypothetical protein
MRLVRYLAAAGALILLLVWITDTARANESTEQTIRRVSQEEGIDGDLAVSVARCESSLRHDARNGKYRGVFQMGPGWASHNRSVEDQTREFAGAVKAGSAARHWACWPRGKAGRGSVGRRTQEPWPPTGTDRCDRATGEWRCHPSWTKPDALTVSPTIETDPGPEIESCAWEGTAWTCVRKGVQMPVQEEQPEVITGTVPSKDPMGLWGWLDVVIPGGIAVLAALRRGGKRDQPGRIKSAANPRV